MAWNIYELIGCLSAFWCGCVCIPQCMRAYERITAAIRVHYRIVNVSIRMSHVQVLIEVMWYLIRNGVEWIRPIAKRCCKVRYVRRQAIKALFIVQTKGQDSSAENIVSFVLACLTIVFVVMSVLVRSVGAGLLCVCVCLWIGHITLTRFETKREEVLRQQVPDAMRSLSACFQAGYSISQAFMQTSQESKSPTKELFARVAQDIEVGRPIAEALQLFKNASGIPELGFVAVALDIQHVTGGSVVPILESAERSVAKSLEMRRFLRTQTAQARLSAQIVSGLPIVMLVLLSVLSPGFMDPFFNSMDGLAILGLAAGLQMIGIVWIKRLLSMEVD